MSRRLGLVACIALALLACSSGDDDAAMGGAAGNAGAAGAAGTAGSGGNGGTAGIGGAGGMSAGAGGAGAGGVGGSSGSAGQGGSGGAQPTTELEACIAYRTAICQRRVECGEYAADTHCPFASEIAICPGSAFAPGSTRTVESLNACSETWRNWPCEKILGRDYYQCEEAGTRQPGEACVFAIQCESVACDGPPPTNANSECRTCRRAWQPGDDCNTDDVGCPGYTSCNGDGECIAYFPNGPTDGTCFDSQHCPVPKQCLAAGSATSGACEDRPAAGEPCGMLFTATPPCSGPQCHICEQTAYCDGATGMCVALPGSGMPCGAAKEGSPACAPDLFCTPDNTCEPKPTAGQACAVAFGSADPVACADNAFCNKQLAAPTCEALPVLGEICNRVTRGTWGWQSETDTTVPPWGCFGGTCMCPDELSSCTDPKCVRIRALDESCTAAGDQCERGATCNAMGVCELVPVDRFAVCTP